MQLGKRIAELRKKKGMSQEEMSELFNVTRQTISSWENQRSFPDLESLIKISDVFNITLDKLLKEDKALVKEIDNKVKKSNRFRNISICLAILVVLGLVISFIAVKKIDANNAHLDYSLSRNVEYEEHIEDTVTVGLMPVKKDGEYNLTMKSTVNTGVLKLIITNGTGFKTYYEVSGKELDINERITLKKGDCWINVEIYEAEELPIKIEYDLKVNSIDE